MPRAPMSATNPAMSTTATRTPHYGSKELSSTSKVAIASVTSCFGVAILASEYIGVIGFKLNDAKAQ